MDNDLTRVVDALPGCVWTARPDGEVDSLNRHCRDYVGLRADGGYGDAWQTAARCPVIYATSQSSVFSLSMFCSRSNRRSI